jgi:hypothetical protein
MSATLILYGSLSGRLDNRRVEAGSIDTPMSIVVKGTRDEATVSIANGASATLYANALGGLNTITIECNQNTRLVLTDTAINQFSLNVRGTGKKDKYGAPLQLTLGNTLNAATTINSIVAHNNSGSTCKVHFVGVK